jgi:diguanylate cyclase (GGDEF)-like protein
MQNGSDPLLLSSLLHEGPPTVLARIERRQWAISSTGISVMFLLALGIASFALPALLAGMGSFYSFLVSDAVRGLVGLILIVDIYVVYEQIQINGLRRNLADNLYRMAIFDPVTNVFNRRYIMERIEIEIARAARQEKALTVLALDLDDFKQINDQYGHPMGDIVLRVFGEQLKRATRGSDIVARLGGDEFIVVLPECSPDQLEMVFSRLQDLNTRTGGLPVAIEFSYGWADYMPGESSGSLLQRADEMLYRDKRSCGTHLVGSLPEKN